MLFMYEVIYEKVIEALINEFSTVGGVGAMGANLPLGTNTKNVLDIDRTKDVKIKKRKRRKFKKNNS